MSASTLSVTAKSRRRLSPVTAVEILNDSSNLDNTVKNAVDDGKIGGANKELSNSEKSKEKKSSQLVNNNVPIRTRTRTKGPPKNHPKARWLTVVRVLSKNLVLLLVLIGLIQMVRKLVNFGDSDFLLGFSDLESRIARVESRINSIAKVIQVEVDVVDSKIGSEVENLRGEIKRRIEGKDGEIEKRVERLEARIEGFKASLEELRSNGVMSKDEFVRMYDEWKRNGGSVDGLGVSYDEIRGIAREIVANEIDKHAADGVGRVDFAVASGGGAVVDHSRSSSIGMFGRWLGEKNWVRKDALKMLTPSFGEPGQCFPLEGSSGYVVIRLRAAIVPEAVTLEHVAKSVAYDRSSAPKHCRVSGFLVGDQGFETRSLDNLMKFNLTDFIYDLEKSHAQTFDVFEEARSSVIDTVLLEFSSNHGSSYTCIYRFRVHGHEPKAIIVVPADS